VDIVDMNIVGAWCRRCLKWQPVVDDFICGDCGASLSEVRYKGKELPALSPREMCEYLLDEWFNKIYPPTVFIGGVGGDSGVVQVVEIRNALVAICGREGD